jgi:hypothetical protein
LALSCACVLPVVAINSHRRQVWHRRREFSIVSSVTQETRIGAAVKD